MPLGLQSESFVLFTLSLFLYTQSQHNFTHSSIKNKLLNYILSLTTHLSSLNVNMQFNYVGNRSEWKQEMPCKSLPNLSIDPDCEAESSLNPYALEFVPSHLKCGKVDVRRAGSQKMKTEATSTTTLMQREFVGDASYLHAQRQLFELLHLLGDKVMPLKAIKVSLDPNGRGINVHFKAKHGIAVKEMLDETMCQDAALHLEMKDRSFIPRRLPNVLAANFLIRMGDVLKNKIEWNEDSVCASPSMVPIKSTSKQLIGRKRKAPTPGSKDLFNPGTGTALREPLAKKQRQEVIHSFGAQATLSKSSIDSKTQLSIPIVDWTGVASSQSKATACQKSVIVKPDSKHEKKSNTRIHTPRQSLGQTIKKGLTGSQKFMPRSTYTSQMRQSQVQKRMSLLKTDNK